MHLNLQRCEIFCTFAFAFESRKSKVESQKPLMASHSVNNETQRSLTYAFGKGLASDAAMRHKGDPCLGSSPKIKIFGDPER